MAIVKPFVCIRPDVKYADKVAALPYDVYDRKEAKAAVQNNALSFLNIDRPETQYPDDFDMYSEKAYETARDLLAFQIKDGIYVTEKEPAYFVYELTMNGRAQTGIVACCAVSDYVNGVIKKHENTLAAKEQDRIRHIRTVGAQTGPIFLAYRKNETLADILAVTRTNTPLYDFVSDDGISHRVWKIHPDFRETIENTFAGINEIYIADGHHRAASAVKVALETGREDETFLSVLFADDELRILPYNRALKDLNGRTKEEFLTEISKIYDVCECSQAVEPAAHGHVGMYLDGQWYELTLKPEFASDDPVKCLDVSRLQDLVLAPLFGIDDPKTNPRISFVGGIRGVKELERLVDSCGYAVAFSMYPTQMSELLAVADAKLLMPPKSTWFEPKLRSGLFIHRLGE